MNMFAIRLKELRKERKCTQTDLSILLDVTRSTVTGYEKGNIIPPIDKLMILSHYFGVSVDYLVGNSNLRESEEASPEDIRSEIKSLLKKLENKNHVLTFRNAPISEKYREILFEILQNALKIGDFIK